MRIIHVLIYIFEKYEVRGLGSGVGTATGYGLDGHGLIPQQENIIMDLL
jgi:hypothetical protein